MRDLQLEARQLGLLLVDEPSTDEQDATIVAWAKAIKAGAPEVVIGRYRPDWAWVPKGDRTQPDIYRLRVLDLLERMQ